MKPPTAKELARTEPRSLDEKEVLKHFLGKTDKEIRALLPTSSNLAEDFMWMQPPGLQYYLPAALDYLSSPESQNDSEFSHGLLCSLAFQASNSHLPKGTVILLQSIAAVVNQSRGKFGLEGPQPLLDKYLKEIGSDAAKDP